MTDTHHRNILDYLRSADEEGAHLHQIVRHLGVAQADHHAIRRALKELVRAGELQRGRGRTYRLSVQPLLFEGSFTLARDGYGFVTIAGQEGRDIFVPQGKTGSALTGDIVRVREDWSSRTRRAGTVIEVLQRTTTRVMGKLQQRGKSYFVLAPDSPAIGAVRVAAEDLGGASPGDDVGVVITSYAEGRDVLSGRVERVLPAPDCASGLIQRIVYKAALPTEFPEAVLDQTKALPKKVRKVDIKGREDWRALPLVTIDGEDAKDFDDAVAWVADEDGRGGGVVYVAIADVAHYTPVESALDLEARRRGTSVYFPGRVTPMLPEALSNHLCSLRPGEDRLAVGTRIRMNGAHHVVEVTVHDVVIHSRARLTYTQVQRLFDGKPAALPPPELHAMLRALEGIANTLRQRRIDGGGIDMDLAESAFTLSEDREQVVAVGSRSRTAATGLIEELMLLANREAAKALGQRRIPAIYRIHEEPDDEKLRRFAVAAAHATGTQRSTERARPAEIQRLLESCHDVDKKRVLYALLLRAMQRARYSATNAGHYGLGFEEYAHTTSPIRRYPDLVVQRLLKRYVAGAGGSLANAERLANTLDTIASECTDTEQRAQQAAWDVEAALKALYMAGRVGDAFDGVVSGLSAHALFITLGDTNVDGYLPLLALPPDEWSFNDRLICLTARRTRAIINLGDKLPVVVAAAVPELGRIELALAESAQRPLRAQAKKAAAGMAIGGKRASRGRTKSA